MRIVEQYSHLNGWEHIKVHKPDIWEDITAVIDSVDAEACRTKMSKEKTMPGKLIYSCPAFNKQFKEGLEKRGWKSSVVRYWVTVDAKLIRRTVGLPPEEQKALIEDAGLTPLRSSNQTDFVKKRIALEVQFGKYSFIAYDLFVKHMAFYVGDTIDVGVEILPMRELTLDPAGGRAMTTGVPNYEGALYDLIRQGRGIPAVPLVLVGVGA
ncbi:MAG: restriction endonuclease [Armatimonadetes bacterium]|nr:restriction endonuclease [Armatimonadota bacterium]